MIRVSVMYPYSAGGRFDHDYYRDKHLPLVKTRLGSACLYYSIDRGQLGPEPPPFIAMCHLFFQSVETFQTAFNPHAPELLGDIPHYTDASPVIQVSEVVIERG